jgi:osmotically-inducible protein OsmY
MFENIQSSLELRIVITLGFAPRNFDIDRNFTVVWENVVLPGLHNSYKIQETIHRVGEWFLPVCALHATGHFGKGHNAMNRRFDRDYENWDWSNERNERDDRSDRDRDDERWAQRWRGERPMRGAGYGGWSSSPPGYNTGSTGYSSSNYGQRTDWDHDRDRDYRRALGDTDERDYRRSMGWGQGEPQHRESFTERVGEKVRRFFGKGPKGYKRSDDRIREDVCDRLSEGWIDASDIEISVSEGEVTLSGYVDERRMKHIAEDLAERVSGVQDVHNHLRVRKQSETETRSTMSSSTMSTTTTNPPPSNNNQGKKSNIHS